MLVRRKFYDIHVAHGSAIAGEAIQRIGKLYDIEREIRGKAAELRCEIRQARARPLMEDLRRWLQKTLAEVWIIILFRWNSGRRSRTAHPVRCGLVI